jgi:putative hydrolase of the HAD superfamily
MKSFRARGAACVPCAGTFSPCVPIDPRVLKVIFFDAAGTLFHLPKGVGYHYALVADRMGLKLEAAALDRAFGACWKAMPARPTTGAPREDDDKGWWRELVDRVFDEVAPQTKDLDRDAFFEVAYEHFAEAGVWELFPETIDVLEQLRPRYRLSMISNFDGRLRMILELLGISKYFSEVIISSEAGADKPDALIYRRALELSGATAGEALHVGDDPEKDWAGAEAAGLSVFKLDRPRNSLNDLLPTLGS